MPLDVRPARRGEMPAIRRLIAQYPTLLMQGDLPRIPSFFVAESDKRIVGCCALQIYSQRLAEVRSLAVDREFRLQRVGALLVDACKARARERAVKQILAVTSAVEFFEKSGFSTFKKERVALFFDLDPAAGA